MRGAEHVKTGAPARLQCSLWALRARPTALEASPPTPRGYSGPQKHWFLAVLGGMPSHISLGGMARISVILGTLPPTFAPASSYDSDYCGLLLLYGLAPPIELDSWIGTPSLIDEAWPKLLHVLLAGLGPEEPESWPEVVDGVALYVGSG